MIARTRCLRILNALQAFAERNGHEAAGFGDLGLPASVELDPCNGQKLVVEEREGQWWVYSTGIPTEFVAQTGDFTTYLLAANPELEYDAAPVSSSVSPDN